MQKHPCQIISFILFLSAFLSIRPVYSQEGKSATFEMKGGDLISLPEKWKFHSGDDSSWALPAFDDSAWDSVKTDLDLKELEEGTFTGIGWFRLKLDIEPDLRNKALGLEIDQMGASEIYVDGKLVYLFGEIDSVEEGYMPRLPLAIQFNDSPNHLIAIRYANHNYQYDKEHYGHTGAGFTASIIELNDSLAGKNISNKAVNFFLLVLFVFLITLSVIHLLLFLFYRKQVQNIYYAIFVFFLSLGFLFIYLIMNTTSPAVYLSLNYYLQVVWILFFLSLLKLVYVLFNPDYHKKLFYIGTVPALAIIIFYNSLNLQYGGIIYLIFILFICIESIRSIITGIIRKQPGARIIATGVGIFILSVLSIIPIVIMEGNLSFSASGFDTTTILILSDFIITITSIPVSMSIYLAYNSAKTNKDLEQKLVEVETLSLKTISQEKEKQHILASQNDLLETQVKERTKEIEGQKATIEEKNKDITDSINYAKRIQEAILPSQKTVEKHFENCFILYKPKDIVAGDFYWMETAPLNPPDVHRGNDNAQAGGNVQGKIPPLGGEGATIFIAAADCTGHGVPGALVSVVCSNALNRAVKEFGLRDTGKILDKVTDLVLETFEKSGSGVKDGMDISLLRIEFGSKNSEKHLTSIQKPVTSIQKPVTSIQKPVTSIQWSGANNPLWYVQDGKIQEIKGDKQPIGKFDIRKPFTTHTIEATLQTIGGNNNAQAGGKELLTFYLFTDGLPDQFGGPKGKKLMYRRFQENINLIHHLPMEEQKIFLEKSFTDWKGGLEQVDDITVIGVKI